MVTTLTRMTRSTSFTVFLLLVGELCLVIHFEIYRQTSASAFINRPEFYYNRFVIRDSSGQWIRDVSVAAGFCSYITAFIGSAALGWGVVRIILKKRR